MAHEDWRAQALETIRTGDVSAATGAVLELTHRLDDVTVFST